MLTSGEFVSDLDKSADGELVAEVPVLQVFVSPTPPDPSRAVSASQYVPKKTNGVQSASIYQGLKRYENLEPSILQTFQE
jgi:hypothetical protein